MNIMGLDPGTVYLGYGIITDTGQYIEDNYLFAKSNIPADDRLLLLANKLDKLIGAKAPNIIAFENVFVKKHPRAALLLAEATRVIKAAAAKYNIPAIGITATEVKKTTTGNGHAAKQQVQAMIQRLLHMPTTPKRDDSADGLAIAYTLWRNIEFLRKIGGKPLVKPSDIAKLLVKKKRHRTIRGRAA